MCVGSFKLKEFEFTNEKTYYMRLGKNSAKADQPKNKDVYGEKDDGNQKNSCAHSN